VLIYKGCRTDAVKLRPHFEFFIFIAAALAVCPVVWVVAMGYRQAQWVASRALHDAFMRYWFPPQQVCRPHARCVHFLPACLPCSPHGLWWPARPAQP
jgi:hypothetical protein